MEWLSGQGEQDYWTWMDARELEDTKTKKLTVISFKPNFEDGVVHTECGRMTPLAAINLS